MDFGRGIAPFTLRGGGFSRYAARTMGSWNTTLLASPPVRGRSRGLAERSRHTGVPRALVSADVNRGRAGPRVARYRKGRAPSAHLLTVSTLSLLLGHRGCSVMKNGPCPLEPEILKVGGTGGDDGCAALGRPRCLHEPPRLDWKPVIGRSYSSGGSPADVVYRIAVPTTTPIENRTMATIAAVPA